MFFLQYECAATKQSSSGKGNTISTIKYSLGRLMRTDANWLVCYNTQGRGREIGGGGLKIYKYLKNDYPNIVKVC